MGKIVAGISSLRAGFPNSALPFVADSLFVLDLTFSALPASTISTLSGVVEDSGTAQQRKSRDSAQGELQ